MGSKGNPLWYWLPIIIVGVIVGVSVVGKVNEDLLPIRFMVIDTMKRRSPVVHGKEKEILQHGIATIAQNATIVDATRIPCLHHRILAVGGGNCATRDA